MVVVLEIFTIFLVMTTILLALGFFKKQYIILMLSGIFILIIGTFLITGVQYKTGNTITTINSTVTTTQNVYSTWNDNITTIPIGSLILLFGLFIITMSWMKILGKNIMLDLWGNDEETEE